MRQKWDSTISVGMRSQIVWYNFFDHISSSWWLIYIVINSWYCNNFLKVWKTTFPVRVGTVVTFLTTITNVFLFLYFYYQQITLHNNKLWNRHILMENNSCHITKVSLFAIKIYQQTLLWLLHSQLIGWQLLNRCEWSHILLAIMWQECTWLIFWM